MSSGYEMEKPNLGLTFRVDRLRREKHELIGELTVKCDPDKVKGAKLVNGILLTGDFNFSEIRSRSDRARLLQQRAGDSVDWYGLLEEFCQGVHGAERDGDPAVDLRTVIKPEPEDDFRIEGIGLPKRHPAILFGDGGTAKSYTALYIAGRLAKQGVPVADFDWELGPEEHRDRLERLFGNEMPAIYYCRCDRPLTAEVDRIRRVCSDYRIKYGIFDSVAFACDGPPEAAEVVGRYVRALGELRIGSLHLAHINRSENSDMKPFGSTFWHNGARSTWNVQTGDDAREGELVLCFFNRKRNLGYKYQPVSMKVYFEPMATTFERMSIDETPEFQEKMSLRWRMRRLLRRGAMDAQAISEALDASIDTLTRTARRYRSEFLAMDGKIGLTERGMKGADTVSGHYAE